MSRSVITTEARITVRSLGAARPGNQDFVLLDTPSPLHPSYQEKANQEWPVT